MADRDETATAIAAALLRATYGDMRLVDPDGEVALADPSRPGGGIVWYPVDDIARMLTDAGLRVVTEPPADLVEHVAEAMYTATVGDEWREIRDTTAPITRRTVEAYRVAARAAITAVQQHQDGGPLAEVAAERARQDAKWGPQNHPDGTGDEGAEWLADALKSLLDNPDSGYTKTWARVLAEEVCEALAESDPAKLRTEVVQVIAVGVAWIEAIDRRAAGVVVQDGGASHG